MTQLKDSASYWSQELPGGRGYWYSNVTHTKTNGVRQLKKKKKKKKTCPYAQVGNASEGSILLDAVWEDNKASHENTESCTKIIEDCPLRRKDTALQFDFL